MSEMRVKGSTANSIEVMICSKVSTPVGMGLTGLAYNTAGFTMCYSRDLAAPVAITLVTQTVAGAWTSGGFVEKDPVKWPGLYRIDVPNAAFLTGVNKVRVGWTGANSIDDGTEVDLVTDDPYAAGLTTAQIGDGVWADADAVGLIATVLATAGYLDTEVAAVLAAVDTEIAAIKAKTDNLPALPAAVGDIPTANITAIKAKTDLIPAAPAAVGDIPTAVQIRTEMDANSADFNTIIAKTNLLPAAPAAVGDIPLATAIADALLARNAKGGSNGPAPESVAAALAGGFMNFDITAGVLTVRHADDTVAHTKTLTRDETALLGAIIAGT